MAGVEFGRNPDALDEAPTGGNELPEPESTDQAIGDRPKVPGFLLSDQLRDGDGGESHRKLAKKALKLWTSQDQLMSRHLAQWKANHARRKGIANVQVVKKADESRWDVHIPLGSRPDALPMTNHAADLCRKATAQMFADPPAPEVEPPSLDDDDIESAQFAERVLLDVQAPNGLYETGTARRAFDRGHVWGSGFVRYFVDPEGGGRVPIQVEAGHDPQTGERATTVQDAAERVVATPVLDELGGPVIDPETFMPAINESVEPWPDFEERFVAPDGTLVDDESEAATRFAPGLKREILTGANLRFLPHTAEDIWDADGVIVATFLPWRRIKKMFPAVRDFTKEQRGKLFRFEPEMSEDILRAKDKGVIPGKAMKDNEDESLVFVLTIYYESGADYPDGCYFVGLADQYVAFRDTWSADTEQGKKTLQVPITQYAQWDEGLDSPYKVGSMQIVGPGNEVRAAQIGAWFDHLERFNNPRQFVPTNSILQPKYKHLPRGEMVPINPGGEPFYEPVPDFPRDAKELFGVVTTEMDNSLGLSSTAQGLETSDVKSGRHAFAVISQAHAGLSELKQNIERGYVRACQIQLELIQAFFTTPQQIKWAGEDGRYRQKAWSGADLGNTTDVRIKPGTMTLLTPAAKAQLLRSYFAEDQILRGDEYRDAVSDALSGAIVLEDDPFRMRIRRQLAEWREGPEGDGQPVPTQDPITLQVTMVDMEAVGIWRPVPSDSLPDVAAVRLQEIAKDMASTRYEKMPDAWRAPLDLEYERMLQAAQPPAPAQPTEGGALTAAQSADVTEQAQAEAISLGI